MTAGFWVLAATAMGAALSEIRAARRVRLQLRRLSAPSAESTPAPKKRRGVSSLSDYRLRSRLRMLPGEFRVAQFGFVLMPAILGWAFRGVWGGAACLAAAVAAGRVIRQSREKKAMRDIQDALPDFLRSIAAAMRAGSTFPAALALIGDETPDPLGTEIRRVVQQQALGYTLDQALAELLEHVPSLDLALVVTAVSIQQETGGSLAVILDKTVQTLVERTRVRREVQTLTAQGRASGLVLSILPIGLGFMIALLNPAYVAPLFHRTLGQIMVGYAACSLVLGNLVMRRMIEPPEV